MLELDDANWQRAHRCLLAKLCYLTQAFVVKPNRLTQMLLGARNGGGEELLELGNTACAAKA